jgi:DNA invertase Pin-like site-specific DNA recombinase
VTVAAYVRVSSKGQDATMQRVAIERAAKARGDVVGRWYFEWASARTLDRKELRRCLYDARHGDFSRLYVWRLDRLARSGIRDLLGVVEDLRRWHVQLVMVTDGFELEGPAADVVLAVLAWTAKMERLAINERIAAARERVEREGRPWGRPPVTSPAQRALILSMREDGASLRQIAGALGVARTTVRRVLTAGPKSSASDGHHSPDRTDEKAGSYDGRFVDPRRVGR